MRVRIALCGFLVVALAAGTRAESPAGRITVLYDAFGGRSDLERDWGFAAFVEHGGKRILFDTGNNAEIFARNVRKLGVDLRTIDFAVISHRHGDHTAGISYLLIVNPAVKIYAPTDGFGGVFGSTIPASYRREPSLPERSRYFEGRPPDRIALGSHWPNAKFVVVDSRVEIAPGVAVIPTVSDKPGTLEMAELSLAIQTPKGLTLVVGCSHPGIEKIVAASRGLAGEVHLIAGGLHLFSTPDADIERVARALHDDWRVERIAPGHCTGEPAFVAFQKVFGKNHVHAGVGAVIELP